MHEDGQALPDTVVQPSVEVIRDDAQTRMVVTGELDFSTVDYVRTFVEDECARSPASLALDLGGVEFADSQALRLLVTTHRTLADGGGRLLLIDASQQVRRLLEVTGLDELFLDERAA
jgi:anti-sigma B factor antagonist